ncbi:MAG: D-2-hydroxyacid dehydrogenase [Candidatus Omnitrophica bacterium]|nr:D-2-hydroxyacid dehydrogenase [Candidatus Omnitrophota bacterium]MDD5670127.1 D-2-hydroxyacid dehydrogenase [Candidatus Omnitrophota bacterium]
MKIVFLDAGTVDSGDVSFGEIRRLGSFKAYHHTSLRQMVSRMRGAQIVITNKCRFDAAMLARLPDLRCLAIAATGTNNVDLAAAAKKKIAVTNVSGYSTETVVQFTFAFLLGLAGDLRKLDQAARNGTWSRSPFFVLTPCRITEIRNKTLGIVGYGAIGQRVAAIARAFGMKVLIGRVPGRTYPMREKIRRVNFDYLVRQSDFISIHAPLTPLTHGLFDGKVLRKMKRGSFLVNMARGGIVEEKALRKVLASGHLAGAATDVLTTEPPPPNHVLLKAPNLLLTPHVAWASREARSRLIHEIALNIEAFQKGRWRHRVA